jgi:very-short-patch-repair endonuclease
LYKNAGLAPLEGTQLCTDAVLTTGVGDPTSSADAGSVGLKGRVPAALARGPFTREDAERAGVKRWHLESDAWKRIAPRTFIAAGLVATPEIRLAAAMQRMPEGGAFSGFTAVWIHSLDNEFREPIEITVPAPAAVSTRSGLLVRRRALDSKDILSVGAFPTTTARRTLHDVATQLTLTEAIVLADRALHLRLLKREALRSSKRLRPFEALIEPLAESPMETRLRMLLVLAGLPRPQAQVPIRNRFYRVIARPDLYYPEYRLALEYDGATHKDSLAEDNRRHNLLTGAGVRLLRFTAGDIYNTPELVVSQVRAELARPR